MAEALAQVTGQSLDSTKLWVEKIEENFPLDIANFCKWVKNTLMGIAIAACSSSSMKSVSLLVKHPDDAQTTNYHRESRNNLWWSRLGDSDFSSRYRLHCWRYARLKSQDFSKIQGRFERISLSSSNTNEVIEKRLLSKTEEAKSHLSELYDAKGDIIRSQLSFEQSNAAEMANYQSSDDFINTYPFVPYQYNLVQKIFTGISRAGASGQHMSRGERSLIDAFQIASKSLPIKTWVA